MKPFYQQVIKQLDLLERLAGFTPVVIGTPPLGIAINSSDIDIACSSPDFDYFIEIATKEFGTENCFSSKKVNHLKQPAALVSFHAHHWEIELFCQNIPVEKQWGVRHFLIEKKLLELNPLLREPILRLKREGFKTEPAFAHILGIPGDPYVELLKLESLDETELHNIINAAVLQR